VLFRSGKILASGSRDKTIRFWDSASKKQIKTLTGHSASVTSLSFNADGTMLLSGSQNGNIRLWDTSKGEHLQTFTGHTDEVQTVIFSPDQNTIASTGVDCTVRLWNLETAEQKHALAGYKQSIGHNPIKWNIMFNSDGNTLASESGYVIHRSKLWKMIYLWDVVKGQHMGTLKGHTSRVWRVAFSPDGKTIASGGGDGTVLLWDTTSILNTLVGSK